MGVLLLLVSSATADNLQSFRAADAAGDQGCATIPYSSLRSRCEYKQGNVNDHCKVEKRSCKDLTVKKIQDNIDGMTSKVEKLNREKCRDHRNEVQGVFADAKSKAQSESDPQIKTIAAPLITRWDNSTRSHEQELKNVIEVIDNCKQTLRGDQ